MKHVSLRAVAAAVPQTFVDAADFAPFYGAAEIARLDERAGLDRRPRLQPNACPVDLALCAARAVLAHADIEPRSIDAVLYVTQTADFLLPATACLVHEQLALGADTAALDINLGCSGYVYGIWVAAGLIRSGLRERILILAGDAGGRFLDPNDRTTAPLFGDAFSASIVEACDGEDAFGAFVLGTDGSGWSNLIVPVGGAAFPDVASFRARPPKELAHLDCQARVTHMVGDEIFAFTLKRVPPLIAHTVRASSLTMDDVDYFVLHQANKLILQQVQRKAAIPAEKLLVSLAQYGNSSSASIPLTICHCLHNREQRTYRTALVGFGVGYSWAATVVRLDSAAIGPVVEFVA